MLTDRKVVRTQVMTCVHTAYPCRAASQHPLTTRYKELEKNLEDTQPRAPKGGTSLGAAVNKAGESVW